MNDNNTISGESFIHIEPTCLINACTTFLEKKLTEMQNLQEQKIQKEMLGGWFKKKESRESVIYRLYGKLWFSMDFVRLSREYSVKRIEQLLSLAHIAKLNLGIVHLYSEDAQILKPYLKG
ncbi:hypothetical protein GW796_09795 [archaeon]|nr:hypothetical protein [archaeon]